MTSIGSKVIFVCAIVMVSCALVDFSSCVCSVGHNLVHGVDIHVEAVIVAVHVAVICWNFGPRKSRFRDPKTDGRGELRDEGHALELLSLQLSRALKG